MSSGGARPKKRSNRNPRSVDRSALPAELQNNFYPDIILIYSPEDALIAQSFLTEIKNKIKEHDYIVAGYLDKEVWVDPTDTLPDYKRCSGFMYLFTRNSVKDFHKLTKHSHLGSLLYGEKFIPVLTEPEGDLDLPMTATVSCPVRYYKQQTSEWVQAVTEFLKKHAKIRREKERNHKKRENAFLDNLPDGIETDEPGTSRNVSNIIVNAGYVNIGENGKIVVNKYAQYDDMLSCTVPHFQNEMQGYPSSNVADELEPPIRSSKDSSQRLRDFKVSFDGTPKSNQSFDNEQTNNLSTPVEDFLSQRSGGAYNGPLSGRVNDVASNEMKQFLPAGSNRPVAREIPTETSFPDLQSLNSVESLEPSTNVAYRSRGPLSECRNHPSPKEICGEMFSFSGITSIPDSNG